MNLLNRAARTVNGSSVSSYRALVSTLPVMGGTYGQSSWSMSLDSLHIGSPTIRHYTKSTLEADHGHGVSCPSREPISLDPRVGISVLFNRCASNHEKAAAALLMSQDIQAGRWHSRLFSSSESMQINQDIVRRKVQELMKDPSLDASIRKSLHNIAGI